MPHQRPTEPPVISERTLLVKPVNYGEAFNEMLGEVERQASRFSRRYDGHVRELDAKQLARAINRVANIYDNVSNVFARALVHEATHEHDPDVQANYDNVFHRVVALYNKVGFFSNELADFGKRKIAALKEEGALTKKQLRWIESCTENRQHFLTKGAQSVAIQLSTVADASWDSLYGKTMSNIRFSVRGKEVSYPELQTLLSSEDPDIRREASRSREKAFEQLGFLFTHMFNTMIERTEISAYLSSHKNGQDEWHAASSIAASIPRRMLHAIEGSDVVHRYAKLHCALAGKQKLPAADLLSSSAFGSVKKFSWDEGVDIILSAFQDFHPEFYRHAKTILDNGWVDAKPRAGKIATCAFAMDGGTKSHPWVVTNYRGDIDSIVTLAHELGHAAGFMLANNQQRTLHNDQTMSVTETAASLAEELVFRELKKREGRPRFRKAVQAHHVSNSMDSLHRASCYKFALETHATYGERGLLSEGYISDQWLNSRREFYGTSMREDSLSKHGWCGASLLFQSPFYYAEYPLTKMIALRFLDRADRGIIKEPGEAFVTMLKKGSTANSPELFTEAGVDITQPDFFKKGMALIERQLDELETCIAEEASAGFLAKTSQRGPMSARKR